MCIGNRFYFIVMKLNYKIEINEVADVLMGVAIDPETGEPKKMFRLNDTGATIVRELQQGGGVDGAVAKLMSGFIVDEATAKESVDSFIKTMIENGLATEES